MAPQLQDGTSTTFKKSKYCMTGGCLLCMVFIYIIFCHADVKEFRGVGNEYRSFVASWYRNLSVVNGNHLETLEPKYAPAAKSSKQKNLFVWSTKCSRLNDISYVFNRKTGSTTLVTIIDRFAKKNRYRLQREIIYHSGLDYWGSMMLYHVNGESTENITLPIIDVDRETRVVFAGVNHTINIVSANEGGLLMQKKTPNTIFVSIVREPTANFESVFNFFKLYKYINIWSPSSTARLKAYLNRPEVYRKKIQTGTRNWSVARNSQAWHMGIDHQYHDQEAIVSKYFSLLEKEFDFVFVTEYYDHSLVMLKQLMCWKMEDILYISRRVRTTHTPMSDKMKKQIRNWNFVDVKLYDMFNRTLWRRIAEYGPNFDKDLTDFIELRDIVTRDCNKNNLLSKTAIELLAKHGSIVVSKRKFCTNLKAFFSMDDSLGISSNVLGVRDFSLKLNGVSDPIKKVTPKTNIDSNNHCIQVNYHKTKKRNQQNKELDIYMSFDQQANVSDTSIWTNGKLYKASIQVSKTPNFQMTVEGKHSEDAYLIDSVSISSGTC
ncbi:uncharacterized protein LOC144350120 [Saccoglossus kowalevskii]